ncbi:hypothetical protein [Arthrobacter sp. A2-55]|uniref:hypothetical protein n=1 Tax=Arthrobacter sp. A2-55 TaxID=2897337 RepID=UPI0021CD3A20|nr:hypothetical protein [Arthrobacter sp. A2-55]MCU6480514.1 hypothetical protein [Arthrobacter sp. A2-55]
MTPTRGTLDSCDNGTATGLAGALEGLARIETLTATYEAGAVKLTRRAEFAEKLGLGPCLRRSIEADRRDARYLSFFAEQIRTALQKGPSQ